MSEDNLVKRHAWGYEAVWANNEKFGAKMMMFNKANSKTSMFFQQHTDKSWFIAAGEFSIKWIDTKDGAVYESIIKEGGVFDVPALKPVSIEALKDGSTINEVNSGIKEDDEHIVFPGTKVGV